MKKLKATHIDLTGSREETLSQLLQLTKMLRTKVSKIRDFPEMETTFQLTLSSASEYEVKKRELEGEQLPFQITQFFSEYQNDNSIMIVKNIVKHFPLKKTFEQITISDTINLSIDEENKCEGKDILHVLACFIHQDMGIILSHQDKMIYIFDSSLFEKTPKDALSGKNNFLGREISEFHSKGKNFGQILPTVFTYLFQAFDLGALEMLSVDLRGAHIYTDGKTEVQRFERDYTFPLFDRGVLQGMIVYADVFFQEISETKNPFEGGTFLQIDYREFQEQFKIKKNGTET